MPAKRKVSVPEVIDSCGDTYWPSAICETPNYVKPLACASCRVPVKAVSESVRRSSRGTQVTVKAHFSLLDRKRHDHKDGCRFAFDTQAGQIAADFATELKRKGSKYVLMLRQPRRDQTGPTDSNTIAPSTDKRIEVHPRPNAEPLDRTIQAAAAVIKLLRLLHDDPVATSAFRARWKSETIRWHDFCFGAGTDLTRLVTLLQRDRDYPIAVHGVVVSRAKAARTGTSWVTTLDTGSTRSGRSVVLRSTDRRAIDFSPGTWVLGYGPWALFPPGDSAREVQLWVERPGSVAKVGD